jgi:ATP-dependent protease ClpP protease subunit
MEGFSMKKFFAFLLVLMLLVMAMPSGSVAEDNEISVVLKRDKDLGPKLPSTAFIMPDKTMVYKLLAGIGTGDYSSLVDVFKVMEIVGSKNLQIILNSPGGSVFDGMALAGLIQEKVKSGYEVEIRGYGIIASAATLVMVSGTKGKRILDSNSFFMVHELSTFEFLSYKNVSEREKEAAINRAIQNKLNKFVAGLTGMNVEEFSKLCKEETWLDPARAVQLGFADKVL